MKNFQSKTGESSPENENIDNTNNNRSSILIGKKGIEIQNEINFEDLT